MTMNRPILFYDGECGFCQSAVQFILEHEKQPDFLFAALQSDYAQQQLPQALTKDLDSLVVLKNEVIYLQSDAVLLIAQSLTFPYSLAKIGRFVPVFIRNKLYKVVAKNRYKLSQRSKICKIPSSNERLRFIK